MQVEFLNIATGVMKDKIGANDIQNVLELKGFIIHQTHYEKSDWSRAFNQFTIACELDMINVISAADSTFIMSSSTSASSETKWLNASLLFLRINYVIIL